LVAAALAGRVVEVITDLGPEALSRYRYGSGCIVRGKIVLTAAHVVAGAVSVVVRDSDKREYAALLEPMFTGDVGGPGPDLALLEISDSAFEGALPPIGLAALNRDSVGGEAVERCHAVGYPWFAETQSAVAVRDTVDAIGVVPALSKLAAGLLSVHVSVAPRPLPQQQVVLEASEWSGMSGAPVFAAGRLLGVVTGHASREGASTLTAVPLTALQTSLVHPGWGPGVTDPAAWWERLGVRSVEDLQRLPIPPPQRPAPVYWATLREFGQALHQRMPQLLGRDRELEEIVAFATGGERYRRLVGGAFSGKTALLYEAVTAGLPDEVDTVCYFLSRRASDASSDRFLAAVVPQLAYLCDVPDPNATRDQYHALWQQAADRAARTGRHLLLVLDGLDEDLLPAGSPSVASLLPMSLNTRVHVLVSSRPHPELPDDVLDGHPLEVPPVLLSPFKGARELIGLARKEINDLARGDDSDLAVDVLGLLTAAQGALSLRDLVALRTEGHVTPTARDTRRMRRLVEDRAARTLERVGPPGNERYRFGHESLREYAMTMPDLCDPQYRQEIDRWASRWRDAGWPVRAAGAEGTPRYLLDTYPSILVGDSRLPQLCGDLGWIEAAIQYAGVGLVLAVLNEAAAANPSSVPVDRVLTVIRSQAHNLKRPQPLGQAGYISRQLWMQAAELGENELAHDILCRLQAQPSSRLMPRWTTRRSSPALSSELGRHGGAVYAAAVLPDGRVVTGGGGGRLLVWDPAHPGNEPVELGRHERPVSEIAVLPDGRVAASYLPSFLGRADGRLLVWDPAHPGNEPVELGRRGHRVSAMAVLPDGRVVTSNDAVGLGSNDGWVLVWDPARPGTDPVELGRYYQSVDAVAVLPDGHVVAGGGDGRVLIWDPARPGSYPVELGRHDGRMNAAAILPDNRVATGGDDGRVLVWNPARPGSYPVELGQHDDQVNAVAALPDGRVIAGAHNGPVLVWDPARPAAGLTELGRHDDHVSAVMALPDGRVATGGFDQRVLLWDCSSPKTVPAIMGRDDGPVNAVAVLPDGRVVAGGRDGRVLIWDPANPGVSPAELGRHDKWVYAVAVMPDGRVATCADDNRVVVWDPARPGIEPTEVSRHGWFMAMAALPDGRLVTGDFAGRVLAWDPAPSGAGPVDLGHQDGPINALAVLRDGRVIAGGGDERVLIWDPARPGAGPAELGRHDGRVYEAAVLPDGRVATGGDDGRVLVWDPARPGVGPAELGRHDNRVCAMTVLPDGRVATGGDDGRVLIWDPTGISNHQAIQLNCSTAALAATPASPAGSDLVIAHEGAGFTFWSIVLEPQILDRLHSRLNDAGFEDGAAPTAAVAPPSSAPSADDATPGSQLVSSGQPGLSHSNATTMPEPSQFDSIAADAMRYAASLRHLDEGLDTCTVLLSVAQVHVRGRWDRIWLHCARSPEDIAAARGRSTVQDPADHPRESWNGIQLTATCAKALRTADRISSRHNLPIAPGVLVLGLLADPSTAAAKALGVGVTIEHDELLHLIEEDLLDASGIRDTS
jgi:WD40 repeat protein